MLSIRPINETLQKAAIEKLNENPDGIAADIEALKIWIKQQPHLRARTDDQFLLAFLRGCKFSLEKAKSKIDKFYTLRTKFSNIFGGNDVDEEKIRAFLNAGTVLILPNPLNDTGPRILIMRSGTYPIDKYSIEDVGQFLTILQEILLIEDDYANIQGVVFMNDLKKATAKDLFQMTPAIMKKFAVFSEQGMPLRPQQSHFFNAPNTFEAIFNLLKPMMSEKQQSRLHVHGSTIEALYKNIPQKYLPKEYGGENGSIPEIIKYWNDKLDEYRDYFKQNANFGTDEKLRPGKPIDFDSIFGMDGSFRKLNVD